MRATVVLIHAILRDWSGARSGHAAEEDVNVSPADTRLGSEASVPPTGYVKARPGQLVVRWLPCLLNGGPIWIKRGH